MAEWETKNMAETLLQSLFTNPKPIAHFGDIYRNLENRIFPDREQIKAFLQTENNSEQVSLAKEIIERMCFDSNYPPPYKLLINLKDVEESSTNKAVAGSYIPQDHFVHMLNLYLLGIYVYFYHPTLNGYLISYFGNTRKKERIKNRNLTSTKDFLSCWKYFCLYHELSYPIEIIYKKNTSPLGSKQFKWVDVFNLIPDMLYREFLAEIVAKLYVTERLINDHHNKNASELFENFDYSFIHISGEPFTEKSSLHSEKIKERYQNFIGVDKLFVFDHFKIMLNFIPKDESLLTVLLDVATGNPIGFMECKASESDRGTFMLSQSGEMSENQLKSMLTDDDQQFVGRYRVMYFIEEKNFKAIKGGMFESSGIDTTKFQNAEKIIGKAEEKFRDEYAYISFSRIKNSQGFGKYLFQIYKAVLDKFDEIFCLSEKVHRYTPSQRSEKVCSFIPQEYWLAADVSPKNKERIYGEYMKKEFASTLVGAIAELLKKNVEENIIEEISNIDNKDKIADILFEELKKFFKNKNILNPILEKASIDTSDYMVDFLQSEIAGANALADAFIDIRKKLGLKYGWGEYVKNAEIETESFFKFLNKEQNICDVIEWIDDELSDRHRLDLCELITEYENPNIRYDHGLYSCLYYLFCNTVFLDIINNASSAAAPELKFLIWDADGRSNKAKLTEKYNFIMKQTAYSILCHNIYSEHFEKSYDRKWTIKKKDSFAYFCCLMDSLQIWDRQKYLKHSRRSWAPQFCYSSYNIYIKDDQLIIKFLSKIRDFEKLKKEKIDTLDTFLENCTDYITMIVVAE
jgi:hypothetical protein